MMIKKLPAHEHVMTPGEVARLFGVGVQAVNKWGLPCQRTKGGHRRYYWNDVKALLEIEQHVNVKDNTGE